MSAEADWLPHVPHPVCDAHPEYDAFYRKAWSLAYDHIRHIPGMPQSPYMDEAFCDTQLWIWDTAFMSLFCKYARSVFPGVESLQNFYAVLYDGRRLPVLLPSDREPDWTGCTPGVPYEIQVHIADNPPLFAWAEYENARMSGDRDRVAHLLYTRQYLQKHYHWIEGLRAPVQLPGVMAPTRLIAEPHGYRWEGGRSGMDNTPRGRTGSHARRKRPNHPELLWVDALCQQILSARMIARLFAVVGDGDNEALWQTRAEEKSALLRARYWDEGDGFFYDIFHGNGEFCKVMTMASYWALTAGAATPAQARTLAAHLGNPAFFGGEVPFVSLARSDSDYQPHGGYWRGAVWLPTAYAALTGLKHYGLHAEAHRTACRLLRHMYRTYADYDPHTIWECYAPEAPEPACGENGPGHRVRPDFCGWSALGPISIYIEFVLGFHTVDAFRRRVEWARPTDLPGRVGLKNLRFGSVITDIVAEGPVCRVTANEAYTLCIDGVSFSVRPGKNTFTL